MTLKLKIGKRYVRRDGAITDPLILNIEGPSAFPFMDPKTKERYTIFGGYWINVESMLDLISEYKPEWRVVIKCDKRANARRLAARVKSDNPYFKITVEKSS